MTPSAPPLPPPLAVAGRLALADALGDTPETVIALHLLCHPAGLARARVLGSLPHFAAAVVENPAFNPDEPTGFGTDPNALWALLRPLPGWTSVNVAPTVAPALVRLIAAATGRPPRLLDDLYHVPPRPVASFPHPAVRLLGPADAPLLDAVPPDLRPARYPTAAELLNEGIAAAAVADGALVALAQTGARSPRHADLAVATLPAFRGRGLATAAAALVAAKIQAAGQVPVWSAGETNHPSLRIARTLGFVPVARRTYVIP